MKNKTWKDLKEGQGELSSLPEGTEGFLKGDTKWNNQEGKTGKFNSFKMKVLCLSKDIIISTWETSIEQKLFVKHIPNTRPDPEPQWTLIKQGKNQIQTKLNRGKKPRETNSGQMVPKRAEGLIGISQKKKSKHVKMSISAWIQFFLFSVSWHLEPCWPRRDSSPQG